VIDALGLAGFPLHRDMLELAGRSRRVRARPRCGLLRGRGRGPRSLDRLLLDRALARRPTATSSSSGASQRGADRYGHRPRLPRDVREVLLRGCTNATATTIGARRAFPPTAQGSDPRPRQASGAPGRSSGWRALGGFSAAPSTATWRARSRRTGGRAAGRGWWRCPRGQGSPPPSSTGRDDVSNPPLIDCVPVSRAMEDDRSRRDKDSGRRGLSQDRPARAGMLSASSAAWS